MNETEHRTRRIVLLGYVITWLLGAGAAAAQPEAKANPQAEQHHRRGKELSKAKEYAAAAVEFAAAYKIDPMPRFLFNLAQSLRLAGTCRESIDAYRAYLDTNPSEEDAKYARNGITLCDQRLAASPPIIDPKPVDPPVTDPKPVDPPVTDVKPVKDTKPFTNEKSPPIVGTPWSPPRHRSLDGLGTALVVAGGASAIASIASYVLARQAGSDTFNSGPLDDYESNRDRASTFQIVSWVTAGASVALIVGGAIRYATRPTPRDTNVVITPTTTGASVLIGGRF